MPDEEPKSQPASLRPVLIFGGVLLLAFLLFLFWQNNPSITGPLTTPIPGIKASPSASPGFSAIQTQAPVSPNETLSFGTATVNVNQSTKNNSDGSRTETLSFSSDQDVTLQVLYVVPKTTYQNATDLKAKNPDFKNAIVLDEDPVLVVPVVIKGGETKTQSTKVPSSSGQVAFYKLVLPDGDFTLKEQQDIGRTLADRLASNQAISLEKLEEKLKFLDQLLANGEIDSATRVNEIKAFLNDPAAQERLQETELQFSTMNPVAVYNVSLIGLGDPLVRLESTFSGLDGVSTLDPYVKLKKLDSSPDGDLIRTRYQLVVDFREPLSKGNDFPFVGDAVPASISYSFPSETPQIYRIPVTLRNADFGRSTSNDALVVPHVFAFADESSVSIPMLNNLPYPLEISQPCLTVRLPTQWDSSSPFTQSVTPIPGCAPVQGKSVIIVSNDLGQRTDAVPHGSELLDFRSAPDYYVSCDEASSIVDNMSEFYEKSVMPVVESESYSSVLSSTAPNPGVSTVIRLADRQLEGDKCTLDYHDSEITLDNGRDYVVSIRSGDSDVSAPTLQVDDLDKSDPRPWKIFSRSTGVEYLETRDQFFKVADNMKQSLIDSGLWDGNGAVQP